MGITRLLDISRRSLRTIDAAMNVVGQNVANAENENYVRQRVTLKSDSFASSGIIMRMSHGTPTAMGVSVHEYERVRDSLLFASTVEARTSLGSAQEEERLLQTVEAVFPTGDGSLHDVMSDFWDSWNTLADYPTDAGVRQSLLGKTEALMSTLKRADGELATMQSGLLAQVSAHVDAINGRLNELAELNPQVEAARIQGAPDFTGEDRRDQIVKELAEYVPIRYVQDGARGYTVSISGITVVQGDRVLTPIEFDTSGSTPAVRFADMQATFAEPAGSDGKLGAVLRTLNETIPDLRSSLDTMAATLVTEVNAIHQNSYGLDGNTGRSFFDSASLSASTLRLSSDVLNNPSAIAASGDATGIGDNSAALDIAALRDQNVLGSGTLSIGDFASTMLGDLGGQLQRASAKAVGQAAVVNHLEAVEQGVSGVSLDEEMTKLIEYQQAYAASARLIETAQQMLDTLFAI